MYREKSDQNYAFFKFMHDIIDAGIWSRLSNASRALYPVLCSFTNEQFSFVWPATNELLRLTGFKTKKPLQQARKELVDAGLIDYIPGTGHTSSRYYFRFDYPGSRIHLDTYRDKMRARRGVRGTPGCPGRVIGGIHMTPQTIILTISTSIFITIVIKWRRLLRNWIQYTISC